MIYLLMGKSGSGKTKLIQSLSASNPNITRVKTYTTRPQRNEADDEYVFVDKLTFEYMQMTNQMVCVRTFTIIKDGKPNSYYYGIRKSDLDINKDQFLILDFKGYIDLLDLYKNRITAFYIYAPENILADRLRQREGYDEGELRRRLKADNSDFDMDLMIEIGTKNQLFFINNEFDEQIAFKTIQDTITKKGQVNND